MAQSLFKACKQVIRDGISGTKDVGGHDVFIEYYTQEDIDENVRKIKYGEASKCTFGDTDESKVVLVASPVLTIPSGFTLTPVSPKKSLVIICNTLINDGTISMTAKAPNVLPHDWYLVGKVDGYDENVVIPAYANNGVIPSYVSENGTRGISGSKCPGSNGISRQCGSGGCGSFGRSIATGATHSGYLYPSGSGYSFGGGAGSPALYGDTSAINQPKQPKNPTYPMRGESYDNYLGGVGNPSGSASQQNFGCGGRIIIFCSEFNNNGSIKTNGISSITNSNATAGGSGGGAVDLFYETAVIGSIVANGGSGVRGNFSGLTSGSGGNGSITYSDGDQAPLWIMPDIFKPREKYMSKGNMIYFLGELVKRINND